jgi:hypothetical protein
VRAFRERGYLCTRLIRDAPAGRRARACRARRRADRASRRCFAAPGSADRSRPRVRRAQPARCHAGEPGRPPARRRADTSADAGATATPPGRAPERDANPRTSSSLSRSRTRRPSARSPASRCPPVLATVSSAAVANPRVQELQALAGPRPRSEHLPGYDRPAPANAGRTGQTRARARAGPPRLRSLPRSRQPAPAVRCQRSPSPSQRLATAGGTAGGARSSSCAVGSRACGHRRTGIRRLRHMPHARLESGLAPSAGSFPTDRVPSSHAGLRERGAGGPVERNPYRVPPSRCLQPPALGDADPAIAEDVGSGGGIPAACPASFRASYPQRARRLRRCRARRLVELRATGSSPSCRESLPRSPWSLPRGRPANRPSCGRTTQSGPLEP